MAEAARTDVGPRLRALREKRGYSLRALAEQSGLSVNAISRIERSETSPTVSSLHRLAMALHIPITEFFDSASPRATVFVPHDERMPSRGSGITMESLGIGLPGQQIEPFLMTLDPGVGGSSSPIIHGGEEFVFCISGEIEYQVGSKNFTMTTGDSLLFQATQPHLCHNASSSEAKLLLVFQAGKSQSRPRKKHLGMK